MGFYIAEQTLKEIQERLNDPHEICGILEIHDLDEERTKQMIIQKNVFKGNSNSCEVPKETGRESPLFFSEELKYHTHPMTSYSYPSFEDLFSVMKKRSDGRSLHSFIFTKWGLWILFPKVEKMGNSNYNNSAKTAYNLHTNKFRINTEVYKRSHLSKTYEDVREDISNYIETVNKLFEKYITIRLYPWEDIERDYGSLNETELEGLVYFEGQGEII